MRGFFLHIFIYLSFCLFPKSIFAQGYDELSERIKNDAKDSVEQTLQQLNLGKQGGEWVSSYFNGDKFVNHPWYNGADAKEAYEEDFDSMYWKTSGGHKEIFMECFDFQILGCCDPNCILKHVGYWWPESVVETNNYCISALGGFEKHKQVEAEKEGHKVTVDLSGKCRDEWLTKKIDLYDSYVNKKGVNYPSGLRGAPNIGQSHTDDSGFPGSQTRFYEAHLVRPLLDVFQAELGVNGANNGTQGQQSLPGASTSQGSVVNPFHPRIEACFPNCLPPKKDIRFAKFFTEDSESNVTKALAELDVTPGQSFKNQQNLPFPLVWRLKEFSLARIVKGNALYKNLWADVVNFYFGLYQMSGGYPAHPLEYSFEQTLEYLNIARDTCTSWRAHDDSQGTLGRPALITDEELPDVKLGVQEVSLERLKRNCLTSQGTQIYPLIGDVDANSERVGVIGAVRRMLEWTSWSGLPQNVRTNPFNDFESIPSLYRIPPAGAALAALEGIDNPIIQAIVQALAGLGGEYVVKSGTADKLQRIYPLDQNNMPSDCFNIKDADSIRRPDLWPKGINKPDPKTGLTGEARFVHWNYRECCMYPGLPMQEPAPDEKDPLSICAPVLE